MQRGLGRGASAIAALDDGLRRRLFLFVRDQGRPVGREEAAAAVGISTKLAAFHLDKLVDRGLLTFGYARPEGRTGRGAGRTSKLYEPSGEEFEVSIPERRYDLAGSLLVKAIREERDDERAGDAAMRVAEREGLGLGERIRSDIRLRPPGAERALTVAEDVLARHGYEPYLEDRGRVALRNCPFHTLSQESPELVCGMNRAFIEGLVRGLGNDTLEVELDPAPGRCCVKLATPRAASPA
jgi:predicted ArsR family transcriptional regulator